MHVSKNNVLSSALTSQQSSSSTHSLKLIFRFPESAQTLRSLHHQLLDCPSADVPLAHKLRLAREISKSVSYVHSFAFVHKNIRPESILSFESSSPHDEHADDTDTDDDHSCMAAHEPGATRVHACLVGFDAFRAAGGATMRNGDALWRPTCTPIPILRPDSR